MTTNDRRDTSVQRQRQPVVTQMKTQTANLFGNIFRHKRMKFPLVSYVLLSLTIVGQAFQCTCDPKRRLVPIVGMRKVAWDALVEQKKWVLAVSSLDNVVTEEKVETKKESTALSFQLQGAVDQKQVYQQGLVVIGIITLLFASNSPALHMVFVNSTIPPPVFLLNAACSLVAMISMLGAGPLLDNAVDKPSLLEIERKQDGGGNNNLDKITRLFVGDQSQTLQAGMELGLWKFLGTLANVYGLSETSAGHGAFLIQLTTLFVPVAQGVSGVPIPRVIWAAIALAISGVALFTQDPNSGASWTGDVACIVAAICYATYDLRLFHWGKRVDPLELITTKIVTQTFLSISVLVAFAWEPTMEFVSSGDANWTLFWLVTIWSGVAVNALAPFLQVGGQQAVGPARAQILYASQPLWAALLSWGLLHESVGIMGGIGGGMFLLAIYLAATADSPDPNCAQDVCET